MSKVDTVMQEIELSKFHRTDTGNAKFIAKLYGNRIRFDHKRDRWLIWNKHIWKPDYDGEIQRIAKLAAEERYRSALKISDSDAKKAVSKWALRSEDNQKINAAISLLKSEAPVSNDGENWDSNPALIGCLNGVVDLTTGKLRDGKPEDLITLSTRINYNSRATCPQWKKFLSEIFNDNQELITYIHKALGYSLTSKMTEQIIFFCYGSGSNGKSVFISVLQKVLGDYSYISPFSTFQKQGIRGNTNDLAALDSKRLVVSSEALGGKHLDEALLKSISGGDPITARYLFKEFRTFNPYCKIWLFVNHKPVVKDDSHGFWRRVRLIPFTRTFAKDKQDKQLTAKLQKEAEGILAWLVEGSLLWKKDGLLPLPKAIEDATAEYQRDSDPITDFIYEVCVVRSDVKVQASDLLKAYKEWWSAQGLTEKEVLGSKSFFQKMGEKFEKSSTKQGKMYLGVCLESSMGDVSSSNSEASDGSILKNTKVSMITPPIDTYVKGWDEASPVNDSIEKKGDSS